VIMLHVGIWHEAVVGRTSALGRERLWLPGIKRQISSTSGAPRLMT
jgi:hypothetical protein